MSIAYIQSLELAPLDPPDVQVERFRGVGGEAAAAIDAGAIVAFGDGVPAQAREDILYSLQFAQRAASAAADRYTAVQAWYEKYVNVLAATGWVLTNFNPSKQQADRTEVEVAAAALEIVAAAAAAAGGVVSAVLPAAIKALRGMAKDDGFITLFEHYGAKGNIGNFQLSDVQQGAGGKLSIVTGAFQIRMAEQQNKFLFFTWREKGVSVWGDATTASFNQALYAELRETVRTRLGGEARKVIAEIPLA